jgi:two-component system NarL family response regulator
MNTERESGDATVLVADSEWATRAGVRRALEPHGLRIVAEVGKASDAVKAAISHRPDLCLVAVHLPGGDVEAIRQIHSALPDTKIVMLTASEREEDLFAALRAGADGYLLKTTSAARLPNAIHGVLRGEAALPRHLTAKLVREFRNRGRGRRLALPGIGQHVELTQRESETLEFLRDRKSTMQIAADLHISQVTVRRHISAIVRKFGVADRSGVLELLEREDPRGNPRNVRL